MKKFYISASTLLGSFDDGTEVGEGMLGARADIADFSEKNNSVLSGQEEFINKIADAVVNRLSNKAEFSAENLEEGGKTELDKFSELLEKYNKTADDVEFEYEGMTDDELEEAFRNAFEESGSEGENPSEDEGEGSTKGEGFADDDKPSDDEPSGDEPSEDHQSVSVIEDEDSTGTKVENSLSYSVTIDGVTKTFAVSLADKINAVSTLVNDTYADADNTWYYCDVYEDDGRYCVMHDFWADRHYRQEYSVKKDVYSLKGDRVQVYAQFLTSDEINKLEKMKSDYAAIESELNEYKYNELHAKREEVVNAEEYSVLKNDKGFKELKENMDDYSPEELSEKADVIFAKYVKSHKGFSMEKQNSGRTLFMNSGNNDAEEKLPYGGLFKNFKNKKNKE